MSRCHALWQLCVRRRKKPEAGDQRAEKSPELPDFFEKVADEGRAVSETRPPTPRTPLLRRRISSMERRMSRWLLLVDHRLEVQRTPLASLP